MGIVPNMDAKAQSIEPLLEMVKADEQRGSAICRIHRTTRQCRANRNGLSCRGIPIARPGVNPSTIMTCVIGGHRGLIMSHGRLRRKRSGIAQTVRK